MKNISTLSLLYLCIILTACSKQTLETENDNLTEDLPVNISVRNSETGNEDKYFPISLYIFNEEGEYISRQDITKEDKTFSTKLKAGSYSISAFSGLDNSEYTFPESPVYDDIIEMKNSYSKTHPLMAGHHDIELSQSSDVTIPIEYCVTAVSFSFSDVPTDATGVTLSISPLSNGYTFSGRYTGNTSKTEVECTFTDGLWKAGPIYIFPSEANNVLLSISVNSDTGTETFNYTYKNRLNPAVPYNFKGKYNGGFTVNVGFDIEGWQPGIDVDFDLVPGENTEGGDTGENPDTGETEVPTVYSDYLPEPNSIWKSFYVWTTKEISSTEIEALIITPDQWPDILAKDAQATLEWYEKDGLSNWRTFTEEETRAFHKAFPGTSEAFEDLNWLLYENNHNQFYCFNKERYLCRNLEYTFNLVDVSSSGTLIIRQAGDKTGYYLRPVKTIKIKLQ